MAKEYSSREALKALMKLMKTGLYEKVDKDSIITSLDQLEGEDVPDGSVLGGQVAKDLKDTIEERLEDLKNETQDQIGEAGGLAPLDETGKVPSEFLPGYVDDVIEMQWAPMPSGGTETDYNKKFGGDGDNEYGNWLTVVPDDDDSYNANVELGDAIAVQTTVGVAPGGYVEGETVGMKGTQVLSDEDSDVSGDDLTEKEDDIKGVTIDITGPVDGSANSEIHVSLAELSATWTDPSDVASKIEAAIEAKFATDNVTNATGESYYKFSNAEVELTADGIVVTYDCTLFTKSVDGVKAAVVIDFTGLNGNDVIGDTLGIKEKTYKFVADEDDADEEVAVVVSYSAGPEKLVAALKAALDEDENLEDDYTITDEGNTVKIEANTPVATTHDLTVTGNNVASVAVVDFVKGKIYVDVVTNYSYRWSGTQLVLITSADMVELKETDIQEMWESLQEDGTEAP